jgi:hypothetical protein
MPIYEVKLCKRCGLSKGSNEFYRRRNGEDLSSYCKECSKSQTTERQRNLKFKAIEYLGGKCHKCGYDKCPAALEFHHTDATEKDFEISKVNTTAWSSAITKELDKCILLCANCHREEHWQEKQFFNLSPKQPKIEHKCSKCGVQKSRDGELCFKCQAQKNEKIKWPSTQELIEMVKATSYTAVAKKLGVSDNAIRKRIKNHPPIDG